MLKKLFLINTLALALLFSSFTVFDEEISTRMINSVEMQNQLLHELMEITNDQNARSRFTLFSADGEPIDLPTINMIASPEFHNGVFQIGLAFDVGDLGYNDKEEIGRLLAGQRPPQEAVDFIMDFAGIPANGAVIDYAVFMRTPPFTGTFDDLTVSDICGMGR